jgi:hypothetical protein
VYAAGAVPGQLVPGMMAAFLTSATFAALAVLVTALVIRTRRPARVTEAPPEELVEALAGEVAAEAA